MKIMTIFKEIRPALLYGGILAILIFALKWLQWKFLIIEISLDIYVGIVAIFFTILGIWIATQLVKTKTRTIIIEKEVPEKHLINETELARLNLNRREYEVLQFLAKGYSNADIAKALFLSLSTVKTHVSNLFVKMEVKSRTQAMEKAKRLNIIH
jgi:two-component system, NarL family, response regulator LiaR